MRPVASVVLVALWLCTVVAACGRDRGSEGADASVSEGQHDLGSADQTVAGPCQKDTDCREGRRCYDGSCIRDDGKCQGDNDCLNDSYCDCGSAADRDGGTCEGRCLPYGLGPRGLFDPTCGRGFLIAEFSPPALKCAWTTPGAPLNARTNVVGTPIVADLDQDGQPEIVFTTFVADNGQPHLMALRADCSVLFDSLAPDGFDAFGYASIAVGDLNGDGSPEVVAADSFSRVVVFDSGGRLLATAPAPFRLFEPPAGAGGPAIADVDGSPPAEIVEGAQVVRWTPGQPVLDVLWTAAPPAARRAYLSFAADLDRDGLPEVIVGRSVYDGVTGEDETPALLRPVTNGGYSAVADFNGDKLPDLVVLDEPVKQGPMVLSVLDVAHSKFLYGPTELPFPPDNDGPPTIADFDGDGRPEIGLAGGSRYLVVDLDCVGPRKQAGCDPNSTIGIRWTLPTFDNSPGTGAAAFDFNGDGAAEIVLRDSCRLRMWSGGTGKAVFAISMTSVTGLEDVTIADVDGDGHAEIIASSDSAFRTCDVAPDPMTGDPWTGITTGIYIWKDPFARWSPARPVWNQHSYHVTNIGDDLKVPAHEQPSWVSPNTYRGQVGPPRPVEQLPDVTAGEASDVDNGQVDCSAKWTLRAMVCNRGPGVLPTDVAGSFYWGDPRKSKAPPICTGRTSMALMPGTCDLVECDLTSPPSDPVDLWFRANDDGTGGLPARECRGGNDLLFLPGAVCGAVH